MAPVEARIEKRRVRIQLAETEGVSAEGPWERLRPTATVDERDLEFAVLENGIVQAAVCLALGGRLLELVDLRTGDPVLPPPDDLRLVEGGCRRVWSPSGLSFGVGGPDRPGSLDSPVYELRSLDGAACVFLHEPLLGTGLSLTLCWLIVAGSAEVTVQAKATNRTDRPEPYGPEWRLGGTWRTGSCEGAAWASAPGGTLVLLGPVEYAEDRHGLRIVCGLGAPTVVPPWRTHTQTVRLVPHGGMAAVSAASREAALWVEGARLRLQSSKPTLATVRLEGGSGETFEAPAELGADAPWEADAPEPPSGVAAEFDGGLALHWPAKPSAPLPQVCAARSVWLDPPAGSAERAFLDGGLPDGEPSLAGPVAMRRAEAALRAGRHAEAAEHWRDAAEADPDCELAWWGLAHASVASGEDPSEALANAHRAGPLEPLLRIQAFLDSPVAEGQGASPLLAQLARCPDAMLAALAHLVGLGRWAEAARAAEDALRASDTPMVRWMLGWCLLSGSRMEAEAAAVFAQAAAAPVAPPLPWRPVEREAVLGACARFPQLPGAAGWAEAARRTATE